jgi:hypothetical protein
MSLVRPIDGATSFRSVYCIAPPPWRFLSVSRLWAGLCFMSFLATHGWIRRFCGSCLLILGDGVGSERERESCQSL